MRTLIVYGDWLIKRQHFKRLYQENKEQKLKCGGLVGFFETLNALIDEVRPARVVVAWDGVESGIQKYAYYAPWQVQKQEQSDKLKRLITEGDLAPVTDREEHDQAIVRQKIKTQHMLENCFVRQLYTDTAEASDLIAAYTRQADQEGDEVFIYSREHEFYQLISENVKVLLPDRKLITVENYEEIVGYDRRNELMLRCFVGNESETVPGIKGMSRGRLIKYFPRLEDDKVSYDELCEYAELKSHENDIQVYQLVLGARDLLIRNARALNLEQPYLTQEDAYVINSMLHLPLSDDRTIDEAKRYFEVDGYGDYIAQSIDDFFSVFYSLMVSEREYRKTYNSIEL